MKGVLNEIRVDNDPRNSQMESPRRRKPKFNESRSKPQLMQPAEFNYPFRLRGTIKKYRIYNLKVHAAPLCIVQYNHG